MIITVNMEANQEYSDRWGGHQLLRMGDMLGSGRCGERGRCGEGEMCERVN